MKIFRKIRLSSLTKGSASKYLIYAIGEVILVVIGILIALYLNDRKDLSDLESQQKNHLILIKEELENNLIIIEKEYDVLSNIVVNLRDLINLTSVNKAEKEINETDLSELLFLPLTRSVEIDYENVAYNEFIASNSLKDIDNKSIRTILRSWDRKLHTLKLQEQVVYEALKKSSDFIEIKGSLKTVLDNYNISETYFEINNSPQTFSNKVVLTSRQFQNILIQYLGVATQLYKKTYPVFMSDINSLIGLIDDELNN